MRRQSRTPYALAIIIAGFVISACTEGHEVPGTRYGLLADAGDGDGDGDGDMADAAPPAPSCDPTQCEGAMSMFLGNTPGCCTDDDVCGLDFSAAGLDECLERDAPGQMDSSCPATSIFGIINLPGCCARGGKCGRLVQQFLPLGCLPGDVEIPIPGLVTGVPASCSFAGPD